MLDADIQKTLTDYAEFFPDDRAVIDELMALKESGADITSRKEFRGHVTCGAIIIGAHGKLLMIHHRALDKWLFPGGHLEQEDRSLRDAAMREVSEETGISEPDIQMPDGVLNRMPIHIDCHPIPANPAKQEPDHRHFDFRYVFRTRTERINLQLDEVRDWEWTGPRQAPEAIRQRLGALDLI